MPCYYAIGKTQSGVRVVRRFFDAENRNNYVQLGLRDTDRQSVTYALARRLLKKHFDFTGTPNGFGIIYI